MQTTYTLAAEFGKSDGKSHRLRIKDVDLSKSAEEIKASLTKLTKLKLFEKNGVELFQEVRHAKIIKKTERTIFNDGKAAKKSAQSQTDQTAAVQTMEEPIKQAKTPDNNREVPETIRIPEDLIITEEWPQPNRFVQTIHADQCVFSCGNRTIDYRGRRSIRPSEADCHRKTHARGTTGSDRRCGEQGISTCKT